MELLRSQKNLVFNLIQSYGLPVSEFRWSYFPDLYDRPIRANGDRYPVLFYGSDIKFFFQFQGGDMERPTKCVFSPGERKAVEYQFRQSWYEMRGTIEYWIRCLRNEITTPDLWESIAQEKQLIQNTATTTDDTTFSPAEKLHVASSLNEIKQYLIATGNINSTQMEFVNDQIKYLEDASSRLTKRDWKSIAVSTLLGIIVTLSLEPEKARGLFRLAGSALSWLLGTTTPNLPGSISI